MPCNGALLDWFVLIDPQYTTNHNRGRDEYCDNIYRVASGEAIPCTTAAEKHGTLQCWLHAQSPAAMSDLSQHLVE